MSSDGRAKELCDLSAKLFNAKDTLNNLQQEIAENFYPERADFTGDFTLGEEITEHLYDSYPVMMRRELGNAFSAMMRPRERQWFKIITGVDEVDARPNVARYLEYLTKTLRSALYDRRSQFVSATKTGDHDFATFGQCVISIEESPTRDHLYFCAHHLRDCAWLESATKAVNHLHRKDGMTPRQQIAMFGAKMVHESVTKAAKEEPNRSFGVNCIVMPTDEYDMIFSSKDKKNGKRLPYVVIYVDTENGKILKEGALSDFIYAVPRWHRISKSQYAFSPATMIALPDGRMAQSMAQIILEAGEKSVDPPLIGVEEAVRSVDIAAGSMSWLDAAYDERLGEALRPLQINADMRSGFAMRQDLREMLTKAFFIDKLALPPADTGKMTATEIQRRYEEYVRNLLPLFEPMETEYNAQILDKAFARLWEMGKFNKDDMPDELSGADLTYQFDSPIQTAASAVVVQQFQEVLGLIGASAEAGISANPVNMDAALKDAVRSTGAPAKWRKTDEEIEEEAQARAAEAEMQNAALMAQTAGEAAGTVADASMKIGQAMQPTPPAAPAKPAGKVVPMRKRAA